MAEYVQALLMKTAMVAVSCCKHALEGSNWVLCKLPCGSAISLVLVQPE
jgi:hypothetical protein